MYSFSISKSITSIGKVVWDKCAGNDNPFLSYIFLKNLEDSKSIGLRNIMVTKLCCYKK